MGMERAARGRPRLDLELATILRAVRRHGRVLRAARELGCSDAYLHGRLQAAGLTLREVLDAPSIPALLKGRDSGAP